VLYYCIKNEINFT